MPPFRYLFADDEGRLFVMTYEKSENPWEYVYDIFNPDGAFIGRVSLGNIRRIYFKGKLTSEETLDAIARKNRLYCLRAKESGYKELVVYKMKWE